jgi:NAD(P)-dependent dehydrogenase (short-subunit alcohol dehydrogenase family)
MERAVASMGVMGPIAEPDAIATVVSWLGCAEAANINGAVVAADGGWSAA